VAQTPAYLVIAVDPVNFEKPYTEKLEGVSHVIKSTPPSLDGEKRVTRGYPAITATIVNLDQPATTYANWFSYVTDDFLSQNREIERAFRMSRALFPREKLRFVGDSGLDDQKIFAQVARVHGEFVIRACHDRQIEVYNPRLQRWEREALFDLVATVPFEFEQEVLFTHARKTRRARMGFGWFKIRLLETQQEVWVLVAHDFEAQHDLILLTNVPLETPGTVRQVYHDWRLRMATVSIKRRDSMSKTCAWRPSNGCAACLCWFCSLHNLWATSDAPGRAPPFSGCANSAGNSDRRVIGMAFMCCYEASVPSGKRLPQSPS
jgi:hypothetical protein